MRHAIRAGAVAAGALILAGCGSTTEQQAATGAMGGAVAGGVVGGPVGAAVGAAAGGAGGSQVDRVVGEDGLVGDDGLFGDGDDSAEAVAEDEIENNDRALAAALEGGQGYATFARLVEASGLEQTLADGSYTIFAPTDEAFRELPAGALEQLEQSPELLREVLGQHIVAGRTLPADEIPEQLPAMGGNEIRVRLADGAPVLTADPAADAPPEDEVALADDRAQIVQGNIGFDAGVVHGIDQVLLPPSLVPDGQG